MKFKLLYPSCVTREILNILNILTTTTELSLVEARNIIYNQMMNNHVTYVGYLCDRPICMGSYIILSKLGHNGGKSALIEDVAVHPDFQGKGYGKELINFLCKQIKKYNVYKIILNCSDKNIPFYEKCGFYKNCNQMRLDIKGD